MKRTAIHPQRRKLVLRREAVAQLTIPELRRAVGGSYCTEWEAWSCRHSNDAVALTCPGADPV